MKRGNEKTILIFLISLIFMISLSTSLNITSSEGNSTTLEYKSESLNIDFDVENETNITWSLENTSSSGNFTIENSTGVLTNNTILEIGNYYLNITATNLTSGNSTSKNFTIFVRDLNAPFIILPNESSFYNNQSISLQFNVTDASEISNQSSVTNLNQSLGNLTFNYTSGILSNSSILGIGNYSINVTVIDIHNNTNSTIFNLEIKNSTIINETNSSSEDNSSDDEEEDIEETCEPDWNCTDWSECEDGTKTRTCEDENDCDNETDKPSEEKNCTVECTPDWNCGEWSKCKNGKKTRTCEDENDCDTSKGKPDEKKSCTTKKPTCEPDWDCTNWSECVNGTKTRNCTDINECENSGGNYTEEKKCSINGENIEIKNSPSIGVIIISIVSALGIATTLYFRSKNIDINKFKKMFKKKK